MAESLNDAVFACQDHTIGVAVVCTVEAVEPSPRVTSESVRDRLVSLAENVVTGRPVHVLELILAEEARATLMLADEEQVRAADARAWMADACDVPLERVTVTRFVGTHAVFGVLADELEDADEQRLDGWWRDAGG
jgi:hypothetical protein